MRTFALNRKVRAVAAVAAAAIVVAMAPLATTSAVAAPPDVVADTPAEYGLCGRVFPDPMAYAPSPQSAPGESPWAKGNAVCRATDFISHDAALRGLNFLEDLFPRFVEVIDLTDPQFDAVLDRELGDGRSAGIADETLVRDRSNLTMVKVTDRESPIAEADREHFVFPLSIHGIERAGIEGGLRAVEDLATWGANEPDKPIMETVTSDEELPEGTRNRPVGEVLEQSVSYFVLANPDGWRRGDKDAGGNSAFMRYNGNGMDMNRDWPTIGWTDLGFTPWSEPETRSFGKVLKSIKSQWSGGIDLHGQIIDRAFSFTLIGGSQRPFDKNQRVMQFVTQAYEDASKRLSWSKLVKPNDGLPGCVESNNLNPEFNPPPCDPRVYGVQYGTIYDSISYTVTGDFGTWIDSPLGLNGDGIDNEMSLSHLANCGTGTCYLAEAEQLHVDGNKSLIYAMLNFRSQEPKSDFDFTGRAAYLLNPRRLKDAGIAAPTAPPGTRPQETIHRVFSRTSGTETHEFEVKGPDQGFYNGGISARVTFNNARSQTRVAPTVALQRQNEEGEWENVGQGAGTDPAYAPSGRKIDHNYPAPGLYRISVSGSPGQTDVVVDFTQAPAWPDPVQAKVDATNMDFFKDLRPFVDRGQLVRVNVNDVLAGRVDLAQFDTVVAVDDAFLPGYQPTSETKEGLTPTGYTDADRDAMAQKMRQFAEGGGNLVLTDDSLRALEWMGVVPAGSVDVDGAYVGHVAFTTDGGTNTTYDDPLAVNMNPDGSSEGPGRRKQIVEPVPLGYNLSNSVPQWRVTNEAITAAGGRIVGTEQANDRATLAEIPLGAGRVRVLGSFLPFPTTEFAHNYGLASYAVTFNGYELAKNLLSWERPE